MRARSRMQRGIATVLTILTGVVLAAAPCATAVETLDQSQELWNAGFSLEQGLALQQTFQPAYGNISAISVFMMHPASISIDVMDRLCGTVLRTGTGSTDQAYDWAKVQFMPPLAVTPDREYAFCVTGTPAPSAYCGKQDNPYARGGLYMNCTPLFGDYDLTFRTYAEDDLVPVESTVWSTVKHLYR